MDHFNAQMKGNVATAITKQVINRRTLGKENKLIILKVNIDEYQQQEDFLRNVFFLFNPLPPFHCYSTHHG